MMIVLNHHHQSFFIAGTRATVAFRAGWHMSAGVASPARVALCATVASGAMLAHGSRTGPTVSSGRPARASTQASQSNGAFRDKQLCSGPFAGT
jgi:hypothetical protein